MSQRQNTSLPPFEQSERTAVLERDLYHLDQRLGELSGTVDVAHNRLFALSERIKRAEWQLDATTSSLQELQKNTVAISDRMPDLESMVRAFRWIMEAVKYILGIAILAGAIAGGQTVEALKAIFN